MMYATWHPSRFSGPAEEAAIAAIWERDRDRWEARARELEALWPGSVADPYASWR